MTIGNRPPSARADGRGLRDLRPISFQLGVQKWAEGSCLVRFGDTQVLCAATIADREAHRQRPREPHDAMVQERNPGLKRDGHAGAIDLGQNIVRQIGERIGELHALGRLP